MQKKLWFGVYGKPYELDEPAFFDEDFPWKKVLEQRFQEIKSELEPLMQNGDGLQPYFDEGLQFPPRNWKTLSFLYWGVKTKKAESMPGLLSLLRDIPGLVNVSVSMLEPNSRILPHSGETNAVFRVHLGLEVPAGLPECGFKVHEEMRPWQEGELLVFLDAHQHEAFNESNGRRYILLLDIMRPEFMHLQRRVCVMALSILSLYWVLAHIPRFPVEKLAANSEKIPGWVIATALLPFKCIWHVAFLLKRGR